MNNIDNNYDTVLTFIILIFSIFYFSTRINLFLENYFHKNNVNYIKLLEKNYFYINFYSSLFNRKRKYNNFINNHLKACINSIEQKYNVNIQSIKLHINNVKFIQLSNYLLLVNSNIINQLNSWLIKYYEEIYSSIFE